MSKITPPPPPPNPVDPKRTSIKPNAPPPPKSTIIDSHIRRPSRNMLQRKESIDDINLVLQTEKTKNPFGLSSLADDTTTPKKSTMTPRRLSLGNTFGRLSDVPSSSSKKKKHKGFFNLFKKKEDEIQISEPEMFKKTMSVRVDTAINPFLKFDGKSEKAIIPIKPPLPMLNKRDVKCREEYFSLIDQMVSQQLLYDEWSSPVVPIEKWTMNYPLGWEKKCLVDTTSIKDGYCIEIGENAETQNTELNDYYFVDVTADYLFFGKYIQNNPEAEHYVLADSKDPVSVSTVPCKHDNFRRAFVCSKRGFLRCFIPNEVTKIKDYSEVFPDISKGRFFKVGSQKKKFEDEISRIEAMSAVTHYKFGVLYRKAGQTTENEMFGNTTASPAFYKFLDLIATKTELKNFTKYRGGLDVKSQSTGLYSYYTTFCEYEIMFHVSTLLPEQPNDLQRVEKKRHIGNDIVVFIFKEHNDTIEQFNPTLMTSQFNHVFVIIDPNTNGEDNDGYTINISCKSSVSPFPPFMTTNYYPHNQETREFILRKVINAERTALFSTAFKGNATKTRAQQLTYLFNSIKE
ncbi:rap GTPase-activating protein, putative [Entamoeba invadens IP1]|uniref:rap GTPase-activating protein, putative n=1 Tax=Entamoeba invadens IP1 TaxID=370355 RepID=UPI0002C3DB51|nr:rap GTPase-activating protein, putative [Entamoeba invadens IP1]ELP93209.1 rap GTPase-activating protein, putative [Entamoeba invadens IP1]|eukprot:XP_004259980.1 rap GTPase-activating protein, putative [Entamoeba invadens IP1]